MEAASNRTDTAASAAAAAAAAAAFSTAASSTAAPTAAASAASTAVQHGLEGIPKWKAALILGTPVAVACALFYSYIKSSKMAPVEDIKSSKMAPVEDLKVPAIQPKTPKTATVKPQQVGERHLFDQSKRNNTTASVTCGKV